MNLTMDKKDNIKIIYHSIRETARITGLSEYSLRERLKNGQLPGLYSGKKYLVNVPNLLKQIEGEEIEG